MHYLLSTQGLVFYNWQHIPPSFSYSSRNILCIENRSGMEKIGLTMNRGQKNMQRYPQALGTLPDMTWNHDGSFALTTRGSFVRQVNKLFSHSRGAFSFRTMDDVEILPVSTLMNFYYYATNLQQQKKIVLLIVTNLLVTNPLH